MKKRLPALLLALSLLTLPALAKENSMDNFIRGGNALAYTGQFSDLSADNPFYENVSALYEYGLSVGKADGTFGLKDDLTVSQAVIFAGRIRSLYRTGDAEAGPAAYASAGQAVCEPYLAYLKAEGLLGDELDSVLFAPATRAQMAHVLANVLPGKALPARNHDLVTQAYATRRFIPDVTEYTPWYQDILKLYRCGISQGSDAAGSFYPDAPITRGAAAAMLTRLADPVLRITPNWDLACDVPAPAGTTLASLVEPGTYIASPVTDAEMDSSIRYMLASGSNQLELTYPNISMVQARQVMEQALRTAKAYCEQSYNGATCTFTSADTITLTFSAASAGDQLPAYRSATMEYAIAVHDRLWSEGLITPDMTEYEKAAVYYDWICRNTLYDFQAGDDSLSHIPYSLFHRGVAVCDGYTGAYNLLLKLEGIRCHAVFTSSHIWTVATLDGREYHIDTTWGDDGDRANSLYFAMTPQLSAQLHQNAA